MTNYERLQRLTEAELAEWMSQRIDCPLCPVSRPICAANDTCIQAWIDYLTEEESEYLKQKKKLVSFLGCRSQLWKEWQIQTIHRFIQFERGIKNENNFV
jgi:hypothetical protein